MFGSLSRLAGDAFKGAKQATEQLAQAAQHAASTSDLTSIAKTPSRSASAQLPVESASSPAPPMGILPPGLEDLSEEERAKIMAVMACAEIDAAEDAKASSALSTTISTSRTSESFFDKEAKPEHLHSTTTPKGADQVRSSTFSLAEPSAPLMTVTASAPTPVARSPTSPTPGPVSAVPSSSSLLDEVDLSHLSADEREQIVAVMKAAETQQGQTLAPVRSSAAQPSPLPSTAYPRSNEPDHLEEELADNLAILSPAEREQILSVMRAADQQAEAVSHEVDEATRSHSPAMQPVLIHESLGDRDGSRTRRMSMEERKTSAEESQSQVPNVMEVRTSEPSKMDDGFESKRQISHGDREMVEVSEVDRARKSDEAIGEREERSRAATRQHSMASSTFSDESSTQLDSGYATVASASYENELGHVFETSPFAATEQQPYHDRQHEQRPEEKEHHEQQQQQQPHQLQEQPISSQSNHDYRVYTSDDFDYTYGDDRRYVLNDEEFETADDKENSYQFEDRTAAHLDDSETAFEHETSQQWTGRKPRMWTTVFADDEEKSERDYGTNVDADLPEEQQLVNDTYHPKDGEPSKIVHDHPAESMVEYSAGGLQSPKDAIQMDDIVYDSFAASEHMDVDDARLISMFHQKAKGHFDDDERRSDTGSTQFTSPATSASSALIQAIPRTQSSSTALDRSPAIILPAQQPSPFAQPEVKKPADIIRPPPAITVTVHEERNRTSDDDSDGETSPSSDEDDYPDQIIEAPSAPSMSYDEVERERERQDAFGKDVLKQIQAFGESANDEFDVQWAHDSLIKRASPKPHIFSVDDSTTPAEGYKDLSMGMEIGAMSEQPKNEPLEVSAVQPSSERKNPFIDDDEDEDTVKITEELATESDEIDYSAAVSYYSNQPFFTHRPGPVYTIPEDEEQDDGHVDTDSKFYAKEKAHRAQTTKIPKVPIMPVMQLKSTTSSSTKPITSGTISPRGNGDMTTTVYSGDYYDQVTKQRKGEILGSRDLMATEPPKSTSSALSSFKPTPTFLPTTTSTTPTIAPLNVEPSTSRPTSMGPLKSPTSPLTPVRSAPPPPDLCSADAATLNGSSSGYAFQADGTTATKPFPLDTTRPSDSFSVKSEISGKVTDDNEEPCSARPSPYDNVVSSMMPFTTVANTTIAQQYATSSSSSSSSYTTTINHHQYTDSTQAPTSTSTTLPSAAVTHLTETLGSRIDANNVNDTNTFTMDDSSAMSKLKRSPAMMLANGTRKHQQQTLESMSAATATAIDSATTTSSATAPVTAPASVSAPCTSASGHLSSLLTSSTTSSSSAKEDDVLSAVSSDMGRRKLPSIPTQRAEKASDAPSAPIYLTSSAPSTAYQPQPQPQQQIHFTQDPRAYSRPSSRTASLTDLSRPSSSASSVISYRTVDPAIIPGATISSDVRPKPPKRQTTSAATGGRPSPILTQASSSRMPSTLARVLLKKELKEVLERRRETLEACEIEANQRQYVVHRMLITGLLPEYRSSDIDDIPNVIPCLLPIELIDGARVIPDFRTATAVPSSSKPLSNANVSATIPQEHISRPPSAQSSTQEIGVSTEDFPFEPRSKSVGCQAESSQTTSKLYSPTCPPSSSTSYRMPSTSLRLQMEHDRYSSSSRLKSVETQTNGLSAHDQRRTKALSPHVSSSRRQKNHIASTSDPNLLESTAKYFAEYDRQLREHGRRMKNRFAFSDDDPVSRESKKLKLLDELAQRKEKISSMTDLTQSELFPTIHPSSDYASTVPHYGSLPHIDYPTTASTSRASRSRLRDFTYRDPMGREPYGYGSLPRNYERYLDMYGYDTTGDADFVYPPNISTRQYDALSRSLRDLNLSADDNIIDPRLRPFRTASTSYLDRHSDLMQPGRCQPYYGSSYPQNVRPQRFAGPQSLPSSDIISQYANYLSNQFMADQQQQQQQMLSDYPNELPTSLPSAYPTSQQYPTHYGAVPSGSHMPSIQDPVLRSSLSDPYRTAAYHRTPSMPTYSAPLSYQPTDTHQSYIQQGQQRSTVQQPSYEYAVGENYNTNIPSYQYPDQSMLQTAQQQQDYRYSSMPSSSMLPPSATYAYQQQQQRQQYLPSSVSQVYSRNEDNYGSRPTAYATEYGNFHRNPALAAATNVDPLGDYSNRNYLRAQQYPNMQSAYGSSLADAQYRAGGGVGMGGIHLTTPNRYLTDPSTLTQQLPSAGASGIVDPYRNYASGLPQQQRYGRAWANGNLMTSNYDAVYPKEDALSRMYATAAYPARSSRISQQQQQSGCGISSLGRYDRRSRRNRNRLPNGTQSARCSDDSDGSGALRRSLSRPRASNIKRILLTRKYHDSNVYNDVGIRVTGGKRLPNGELGAFISTVNRAKARETLGEVKEGDQVLEWNGVLLTGKTFEEVERVIAASKGEIEIIISSNAGQESCSSRHQRTKTTNFCDDVDGKCCSRKDKKYESSNLKGSYHKEAPPIPAHRCVDGRASPSFDYQSSKNALLDSVPLKATISRHNRTSTFEPESLGYLNVALSYNRLSSTLFVTVLSARGLSYRQYSSTAFYPNPFVKIYLLPGRKVSNKRRTKFVPNTCDPVWNQTVEYMIPMQELYGHYLEFTVWDYDKINDNNSLGQVVISLSEPYVLNGVARWYPLQALHHNFAVSGLPGVQFDTAIGTVNRSYNTSQYNPVSLDIGYPAIN